ncbi:MAG: hypothetical protein ACLQNE_18500 [Thermoguttaceae bacterium]
MRVQLRRREELLDGGASKTKAVVEGYPTVRAARQTRVRVNHLE